QHRNTYGQARLLLADEVGLGKTLALAASAMMAALLDDGPVLILCPSTLTLEWQVRLKNKIRIPSAGVPAGKKVWEDEHGHTIKTRGLEDIARCPFRIAIVSTGLIFHGSEQSIAPRVRPGWSTAASFSASITIRPAGSLPHCRRFYLMNPWPYT